MLPELVISSATKSPKVVVLFANTDWYLLNFRLPLMKRLRDDGWRVIGLAPDGPYLQKLRDEGFEAIAAPLDARSLNPGTELVSIARLVTLFRELRPAVVHAFTIKCVLYAGLAVRFDKRVSVVNAITGLGHVFTTDSTKTRLLRPGIKRLYRLVFSNPRMQAIFQNSADRDEFVSHGLLKPSQCEVIRGSGVDCVEFSPERNRVVNSPRRLLFASRLLGEKGVYEYLAAVSQLRSEGAAFESWIAGDIFSPNPSSLSSRELEALKVRGEHKFLGHRDDMAALFSQVDAVVLPTWREGTPKVLLEAAACGLPIIATDIPGNAGIVEPGENGWLVPVKDVSSLVAAMAEFLSAKDSELLDMQNASRKIATSRFSAESVNKATLAVYSAVCSR